MWMGQNGVEEEQKRELERNVMDSIFFMGYVGIRLIFVVEAHLVVPVIPRAGDLLLLSLFSLSKKKNICM